MLTILFLEITLYIANDQLLPIRLYAFFFENGINLETLSN